jgi:hypothetical protein
MGEVKSGERMDEIAENMQHITNIKMETLKKAA